MRRVLLVSPHFPPDSSAGAHRVRLLAPHLPGRGWDPTVLTVDSRDYEGRLDPGLAALVSPSLRVIRTRAWPARWTRRLGVGDLGIRALPGLARACSRLLERERFDAVVVTVYPTYPALLGPWLKRRYEIPFVLDYQDPWIGEWGRSVGPGPDGAPDLKSRLSRALATRLERRVVRATDAITAVSRATHEQVLARYPEVRRVPCAAIPLGGEPTDLDRVRAARGANPHFDPGDGDVHLCCVGTFLPLGLETLRAVLAAVAALHGCRPDLYARLRLHFFGTSNQRRSDAAPRVLPVARELGVADRVTEVAPRVDYLEALAVQVQATALLLMGSSEHHYTASRLYPALLARRPLLAVYHQASSVVGALQEICRPPTVRLVTYDDTARAESRADAIAGELAQLIECPAYDPADIDARALHGWSAEAMAARLAGVLDGLLGGRR